MEVLFPECNVECMETTPKKNIEMESVKNQSKYHASSHFMNFGRKSFVYNNTLTINSSEDLDA